MKKRQTQEYRTESDNNHDYDYYYEYLLCTTTKPMGTVPPSEFSSCFYG